MSKEFLSFKTCQLDEIAEKIVTTNERIRNKFPHSFQFYNHQSILFTIQENFIQLLTKTTIAIWSQICWSISSAMKSWHSWIMPDIITGLKHFSTWHRDNNWWDGWWCVILATTVDKLTTTFSVYASTFQFAPYEWATVIIGTIAYLDTTTTVNAVNWNGLFLN